MRGTVTATAGDAELCFGGRVGGLREREEARTAGEVEYMATEKARGTKAANQGCAEEADERGLSTRAERAVLV